MTQTNMGVTAHIIFIMHDLHTNCLRQRIDGLALLLFHIKGFSSAQYIYVYKTNGMHSMKQSEGKIRIERKRESNRQKTNLEIQSTVDSG